MRICRTGNISDLRMSHQTKLGDMGWAWNLNMEDETAYKILTWETKGIVGSKGK
jgi:hypothetical protein